MSSLSLKRFKFAIWTLSFIPAAAFVYPKSFFTSTSYRLDNMKAKPLSIMIESKVIVRASSNDANYGEENEEEEELLGARGSMATFTVEPQEAGQRLDMFLAARVGGQSRSYLASLIADGHVVDPESGRAVNKKAGKVKQGDTLSVTFTMNDLFTITAEDIPLDIIYEDEDLIAVNKAPGVVVHPAPGNWNGTLVNALAHRIEQGAGWKKDAAQRPGIVHRLDKGTSGVIVVAKTPEALAFFSGAFKDRTVSKTYLAIAVGLPQPDEPRAGPSYTSSIPTEGSDVKTEGAAPAPVTAAGKFAEVWVDEPIGRHSIHRQKMAVVPEGRSARSRVAPLAYNSKLSLCRVGIDTGRTHQIRVHLAHLRHPVLGDELYGFKDWNDRYSKVPQGVKPSEDAVSTNGSHRARVVRPLLHAAELVLPLPPWSISTLGRYEGSNDGGSQQQQHSATVEECPADYGSASGSKQLRLRCGMPSDFASVARTITGEDMNFNELLGPLPSSDGEEASTAALPSSSATSPSAIKYQASSPQQQKEGPSKVTKEHRAALLAAAEASEDGWYE